MEADAPLASPERHESGPESAARAAEGGLPRALVVLLAAASVVIVVAGIAGVSWLVGPLFLALVIVITVHPVHGRLVRLGLPGWAASGVVLLCVYGVLLVLAGTIVVSAARLATVLPGYAAEANGLLSGVLGRLAEFGVGPEQLRALAASLDTSRLVGLVSGLLLGLTGLLGNLVFLLSLLLFLSFEAAGVDRRRALLAEDHAEAAAALALFASGTRRYMAVNTVFGLLVGAVDAVALALLGVPLAVLWGLLAFITNYIPYVGFWVGLVPPMVLALLVGGWPLTVTVVAIYLVVNFVLTSLIQPRFIGDAVGLSVTVVLVGLVFWGWLLGPIGAVLATPLTLLAKVLLVDVDPRAHWANALIGSSPRPRTPASAAVEDPVASPSPP
ncbi:AI-2E family transporter [Pseudonocardia sp. WMMC193]|uniref:AI-2E family transporter n=1 Tax=Pseudonocardia sp. WMMC193 TaxID=2911965 RepID=UPI001F1D3456|nr:AI-2E family transporter [Pseudonocardia sp. WMMC193]MCF7547809.1 AI-2E family transporter [Pseudonocardia sp. WMMC193]